MKLYYSPGACSMAPHILINELGIDAELIKVDLKSHKTEKGEDFYSINPKGYVPALINDDGALMTENAAIDLYLGRMQPEKKLVFTDDRHSQGLLETLLYITTELHKGIGQIAFSPLDESAKAELRKAVRKKLDYTDSQLKSEFAYGDGFTVADPYLFVVLSWSEKAGFKLSEWKNISRYMAMMSKRPSVVKAAQVEGVPLPKV